MKKYLISTVIVTMFISLSCSNKIHIIEFNEKQKKQITIENLNLFKEREYVNVFKINKSNIREEIENIKKITVRENLMPSTIFSYAFVLKRDTIYASGNLKYWCYKGRVQMYTSKVINTESIENIINN